MERRKALNLRETEDAAEWLKQCLQVEVVSRDRSLLYANAVNIALPRVARIADRFYPVKNIYEVLEKILHRERKSIGQVSDQVRQTANRISPEKRKPLDNNGDKVFTEPVTKKEKSA